MVYQKGEPSHVEKEIRSLDEQTGSVSNCEKLNTRNPGNVDKLGEYCEGEPEILI